MRVYGLVVTPGSQQLEESVTWSPIVELSLFSRRYLSQDFVTSYVRIKTDLTFDPWRASRSPVLYPAVFRGRPFQLSRLWPQVLPYPSSYTQIEWHAPYPSWLFVWRRQ